MLYIVCFGSSLSYIGSPFLEKKKDSRGEKSPSPAGQRPRLGVPDFHYGGSSYPSHSLLPSNAHLQTTSACGGGPLRNGAVQMNWGQIWLGLDRQGWPVLSWEA